MFWTYVIGIVVFALILGIIVLLHEGGHFIMARRAGIMCYEFAIGMGPVIYSKKKGETVYSIRAIPIGGFVSMAGEEVESNVLTGYHRCQLVINNGIVEEIMVDEKKFDSNQPIYSIVSNDLIGTKEALPDELYIIVKDDEDNEIKYVVKRDVIIKFPKKQVIQNAPYEKNFVNKSIGERFLAVFAGPFMNFVLAIVVFFILGICTGYADPNVTYIDNIVDGTPAYEAGLRDGDEILYITTDSLDSIKEEDYFTKWEDISKALNDCATGKVDYAGYLNVLYCRDDTINKTKVYPNNYINTIQIAFAHAYNDDNNNLLIGEFARNNETSLSYKAGIRKGDTLVSVNGVVFNNRAEAMAYFYSDASQEKFEYEVVVERAGKQETYTIDGFSMQALFDNGIQPSKVQMEITSEYQRSFLKNLYMPFVETGNSALLVFKTLGLLFTDKSVGISDLSGPIGILDATVSMIDIRDANGKLMIGEIIISLLNWIAMLSVNIGLLNILPLPALDGGRIAFIIYEAITRKKPNAKVENIIHSIGFILLMALFVFVAFNDVLRLFG